MFSPITRFSLRLGQVAVYQHHCHRPFADGGCHSFGGFGTHITCNKHTRHTCFQMVRRTVQRPATHVTQVGPGQDEAVVIAGDHTVEPVGARFGADENEHAAAAEFLALVGLGVFQADALPGDHCP